MSWWKYNLSVAGDFKVVIDTTSAYNDTAPDMFQSKLAPSIDIFLGCYMAVISLLSCSLNLLVLISVYKRKRPVGALEIYVINLAFLDLFPALVSYPFDISSLLLHRWSFGMLGCKVAATTVYFFGVASITTVAVMSVMRYLKTCHNNTDHLITRKTVYCTLVVIYLNSSLWAFCPLLGWGSYSPEYFGVTCSLTWEQLPLSYLVSIFLFQFILPLLLMVYCYGRMICKLCVAHRNMKTVKKRMDIYMTKMTVVMSVAFMTAWTPYAIVSFYAYIRDISTVPLFLIVAAPYTAKSSSTYNPIIYFLIVKRFRQDVSELCATMFRRHAKPQDITMTMQSRMSSDDSVKKNMSFFLGDRGLTTKEKVKLNLPSSSLECESKKELLAVNQD